MLVILMINLDNSIVNPALPTIVGELHGLERMEWVVTGYVLVTTMVMPLYGKLGDLLGRKYVYLFAIAVFLIGSMLNGLSRTMTELIAFRALQGVGAGGLMVSAMAIIADIVSPRERGRYMGIVMAATTVSTVAGPLLGGLLTDQVSWRWCFYVNLPVGVAALLVIAFALPAAPRPRAFRFDILGAVLLATATACFVLLTNWGATTYGSISWPILALIAGLASAAIGFVVAERRAAEPIIPLRLFRDSTFTLLILIALIAGFVTFGSIAFLPTFLQMVDAVSATMSGLLTLPLMGGIIVANTVTGLIMSASGRYRMFLMLGAVLGATGLGLLSRMSASTSALENGAFMAVLGVGLGMLMSVLVPLVQNTAPPEDLGVATSSNSFFRQAGAAVGTSVVGAIFTRRVIDALPDGAGPRIPNIQAITPAVVRGLPPPLRDAFVHAYATALPPIFLYLVPLLALALVLAWFVKDPPLAPHHADHAGARSGRQTH
jgi:EmrB/QacA subfamily drug resistance transporter